MKRSGEHLVGVHPEGELDAPAPVIEVVLGYCGKCGRDVDGAFCDHCGRNTQ